MGKNYVIDGSFQLVRTNPRLTGNVKVVVDSSSGIYLESFNSNKLLNDDKYKHYLLSRDSLYENKVHVFFDGLPANVAFDVQLDDDKSIQYDDYSNQFNPMYYSGADKIEDNNFYKEEFEYFAPLYIKKGDVPAGFIVMRIDEPGVFDDVLSDYRLISTNRGNFRNEVVGKWKCVKFFDMSYQDNFGYWMNKNFVNNDRFPITPLEVDFKKYNYTRFHGIDYTTGVYTDKSMYLGDFFYYEQPHFKMEEFITNSYRDNGLLFPNILNIKFLFDDTPATPYSLRKYSMNRYAGFYVKDLTFVRMLTPYVQPDINSGVTIKNNVFYDSYNNYTSPFINMMWDDDQRYFVYASNDLHEVIRVSSGNGYMYKLISPVDVTMPDILSSGQYCGVSVDLTGDVNVLTPSTSGVYGEFYIDKYMDSNGVNDMYADLYLIQVNGEYHVLKSSIGDDGGFTYTIQSDHGIRVNSTTLKYWIVNENVPDYVTTVDVNPSDADGKPVMFNVYKVMFSDVRDFDYDRVETGFADYELDRTDSYNNYNERKLYTTDMLDPDVNKGFLKYETGHEHQGKNKVVSSEYSATNELFEIKENGLTDIWGKNQYVCKWGYVGSNSHSDYPYKLNNSNKVGFEYNMTTNTSLAIADKLKKTNEYFYLVGDVTFRGDTTAYRNQTLSVETGTYTDGLTQVSMTGFDVSVYEKSYVDYFSFFFKNTRLNQEGGLEQTTKYAVTTNGSKYLNSSVLFKGLKYNVNSISNIVRDSYGTVTSIIYDKSRVYNDYKFAVICVNDDSRIPGSVDVYLNDKYRNMLCIMFSNNVYTTDVDRMYDHGNNADKFTAAAFINRVNSTESVNYIHIDTGGNLARYSDPAMKLHSSDGMYTKTTWGKDYPPVILSIDVADVVVTKRSSYNKIAVKGPKFNIYDKFKVDYNEIPYDKSFIKYPLSVIINRNETELKPVPQKHGEKQEYTNTVYRYSGPYEPIFRDVEMFEHYNYMMYYSNSFNATNGAGRVANQKSGSTYNWFYENKDIGACDGEFCVCDVSTTAPASGLTSYLICSKFGFNIPVDSIVNKVELTVKKKADVQNLYSFVGDKRIYVTLSGSGTTVGRYLSGNLANQSVKWPTTVSAVTYQFVNSTGTLTPPVVNDDDFGVVIQAYSWNRHGVNTVMNGAYVECVGIKVYYTLTVDGNSVANYVEFGKNYRFDTSIDEFGIIHGQQYSKVNEDGVVLKIRNNEEDTSIYPMIDEFGLQSGARFVFQGNFDSGYYTRTTKNTIE